MASSALPWPTGRITVGLSPASLPKRGSGLDLGIAIAVLAATTPLPQAAEVSRWVFVGEVGLDGSVRPVGSVLPAALAAREAHAPQLVVPAANSRERPPWSPGYRCCRSSRCATCGRCLSATTPPLLQRLKPPTAVTARPPRPVGHRGPNCLIWPTSGQEQARRALMVAAAGAHHLCLAGPAGVGKTLIASTLASLLPDLDDEEALEVTAIRALTEPGAPPGLIRRPP